MPLLSLIAACMIATFALAYVATPVFMRFLRNIGVTAIDQQKHDKPVVPTSGGIPVIFAFFMGILLFIALNTFVFKENSIDLTQILAALLSIFAITFVGFFDDLYVKKTIQKNASDSLEYRVGLKQWMKPLLTLVAAVPLMAVSAGVTSMSFPFIGVIDLGVLYALILIPIAVVAVSNAANMLAGVNGLEAGVMIPAALAIGAWAFFYGDVQGAVIAFTGAAALAAFLLFNWPPARMLPGDSLTYFSGAMFVSAVILGNVEKFGLVVFTPWMIEAVLKLRGRLAVRSYGDLTPAGVIKAPYAKTYSLTHAAMKLLGKNATERNVTLSLIGFEILVIIAAFFVVKPI